LTDTERRALQYRRLHEVGYRFTWPPRIGDLTHRQVKLIQLAEAVEADIKRKQHEQQRNPESQSHDHYDATGSREETFGDLG
jgi:hypothetical protein